ncbi:SWIM zinc finger family protein [bacterium AH-315-J21]|nr:SWIM zinc finger family protein [bacterium AH-315-J21]
MRLSGFIHAQQYPFLHASAVSYIFAFDMNSATKLLLAKTDAEIWRRGVAYLDRGLVHLDIRDDKAVVATVQGTKSYRVSMTLIPRGIKPKCDCPYFTKNGRICKHLVAVAIAWDESRGIPRPKQTDVSYATKPQRLSHGEINRLFSDSLNANLELVRVLPEKTAFSGRGRPHSQLPDIPRLCTDDCEPLTLKEIRGCFSEIKRWARRKTFDPYFCSGEMVAAFCEVLRIVARRLLVTPPSLSAEILVLCQRFNITMMTELIDDSLGLHELAECHLEEMYRLLKNASIPVRDSTQIESLLKEYEELRGEY